MSTPLRSFTLVVCLLISLAASASAQQTSASGREGALKVFLDCDWCDEQYFRTEVTFIDYMRDRKDADVHVLVTTQGTGGGGTEYTLKFIGSTVRQRRADAQGCRSADGHV
jgi:hypothetical protein